MRIALPIALLLTACHPNRGVPDVQIVSAGLQRFDMTRMAAVIGALDGDATLVYEQTNGETHSIPVHLGGGTFGVAFDISIDPDGDHMVPLDLSHSDNRLHDVFGTYSGTSAGGGMVLEGSASRMRNGHGVSFREDHLALGIGFYAGVEWIVLRPGGGDDLELGDTGGGIDFDAPEPAIPEVESGGGCSGPSEEPLVEPDPTQTATGSGTGTGTGATGSGTGAGTGTGTGGTPTGGTQTGEAPVESKGGCSCGGDDEEPDPTGSTGSTGSTGGSTGSTGSTGSSESSSSSSDCGGCGSSSSGCDSGCSSTGGGRIPPVFGLLIGLLLRRRRR